MIESSGKNFAVLLSPQADVILGDENSIGFKPHARVRRWGDEGSFAFGLLTAKNIQPTFDGSKIEWVDGDSLLRWYALSPTTRDERGGFEFEYVLGVKPPSNVFTFACELTGLDAVYQPPLTDFEVRRGNTRPANVVGSYAFYKSNHSRLYTIAGEGEKYQGGKAFHLYRPEAIDAKGNRAWGDMRYDPDALTLTVTFDAAWLDAAAYPVLIDPTVGYTSLGASADGTGDYCLANKFAAPSAGDANPGTAYVGCRSAGGTAVVMFGSYPTGSTPDGKSLIAESGQISADGTMAFRSAAITWTGITATDYWLSINNQFVAGFNGETAYDAGLDCYYFQRTHNNHMPNPWGTNLGFFDAKISMYVDFTASGGGSTSRGSTGALMIIGVGL